MKYMALLLLTTSCAGIHTLNSSHITKDGRCYEESVISDNGILRKAYHEEPCGVIVLPKI